jgi:site-specific recombinase XerD
MIWQYWVNLFAQTHCTARGLRPKTIAAYKVTLEQFWDYLLQHNAELSPDTVSARDVLAYVQHLRTARENGDAAVNRVVTILKVFYRAMVAMDMMDYQHNPMIGFPKIKAVAKKLPVVLTDKEMKKLLTLPPKNTVIGIRDRAILALLYGTGIRVSECATLTEECVDLPSKLVTVIGKGGHQRSVPLNEHVVTALTNYRYQRGAALPKTPFFRCRNGNAMQRRTIYERVRTWGERSHIPKRISPHKLRHTFATHLLKAGVGIVTLRDLLGHKQITSTQVYLHVTAQDLREAAEKHPIKKLLSSVELLLPSLRLPMQLGPKRRRYG